MICNFRTICLASIPLIALLLLLTAGCGNDEDRPDPGAVTIDGLDAYESSDIHISETGPMRRTAAVELLEQWDKATKAEPRAEKNEESSALGTRSSALDSLIDASLRIIANAPPSELRLTDLSQQEFDAMLPDRRLATQHILVERVERFRNMTRALIDRAADHIIAGETDKAAPLLHGLKRWSEANARTDLILIVQYNGKAVQQHAEMLLNDLRDLEETDEREP